MPRHNIGNINDFPQERGVHVQVDGTDIAVFRIEEKFYAILDRCIHKNLPLHPSGQKGLTERDRNIEMGGIVCEEDGSDCAVKCPWHGLEWKLESGRNDVMDVSIPTFDIEVEGDNVWLIK